LTRVLPEAPSMCIDRAAQANGEFTNAWHAEVVE
jgi:hypothetical protein